MSSKIAADRQTERGAQASQEKAGRKAPGKARRAGGGSDTTASGGKANGAAGDAGAGAGGRAGDWEMTDELSSAFGLGGATTASGAASKPSLAAGSAVQAIGDLDSSSPADTHAAAAAGVSGSGAALPHLDKVQRAFGAHSLDGVRAHVGGDAASASAAIGADAYALGDHIAFKQQPDLHAVAHEAAHVVQQRAGVQLKDGLGQKGDAYEQKADAVADAVVAGQSAEALLGPAASSASAGGGAPAIQKQETPAAEDVPTRARRYAQRVRDALAATTLLVFSTPDGGAVRDALSQPADVVRALRDIYNAEMNTLSGRGLTADIGEKFGGEEREFMGMLFTRAGIPFDAAAFTVHSQNAAGGYDTETRITASPEVASAPPDASITYTVERGAEMYATGSFYSYRWTCINDPMTREQHRAPVQVEGPSTPSWNATWGFPGTHTIICRMQFHPAGEAARPPEFLEYRQNVRPLEEIGAAAFESAESAEFVRFRAGLEMHTLDLTQNGVPDQNFGGTHITTDGPNPAVPAMAPNSAFHNYDVEPIPGATRFRWYAVPEDMTAMPTESYHGFRRIDVNGRGAYDQGTGRTARWIIADYNVFTIHCEQRGDDNQFLGEATYRQVVHSQENQDVANRWGEYTARVDQQIQGIDPQRRVGVRASYVSGENGTTISPTFFIGPDATNPGQLKLLDLTPGISRIEYGGGDVAGALSDFRSGNSYPRGRITFEIPANDAGVAAGTHVIETDGSSDFATWASGLGWASLGLAVAGIAASVIPGGQVFAPALFIAAAGVGTVSSGLSIYDQLQQAEVSGLSIAVDVLGIASNIVGAGVAFRAARAGTAVAITGRARMLLYAGAAFDVSGGVLLTVDGFDQILAVLDGQLPEGEKISAIVRILASLAINGGLIALSVREAGSTTAHPHAGTTGDPNLPAGTTGTNGTAGAAGLPGGLPSAALPDASAARTRLTGLLGADSLAGLSDDVARGLDTLGDPALRALAGATPTQLAHVAQLATLSPTAANQLARVMGGDLSLHTIVDAGGGQLRINGQLDIHPSALAGISDDDLRAILAGTLLTDPAARLAALQPFTRSGSYRLRFRFQLDGVEAAIGDMLTRAGFGPEHAARVRLFGSMDDAARARLNDINRGGWPHADLPNRAIQYAFSQNPATVREFVEHFEMFAAEFDRLARARTAGTPRAAFNQSVLDQLTPEYMRTRNAELLGNLDGRVGATPLGGADIPDADLVASVRALPDVRFGTESAAVYHANKHGHELPAAHRPAGGNIVSDYLNSANLTIREGATEIIVVQNGSRQIVFTHTFPGPPQVTMRARVFVTAEGNAVLATYGTVAPR